MHRSLYSAAALVALIAAPAIGQDAMPTAPAAMSFIDAQQPQEMLAGDLIGTPVHNADDQSLGDVNDAILDADGRLKAIVVGVGGFLGIAERNVAVPWDAVEVSRGDAQAIALRLNVDRKQLEAAPEFESLEERRMAEEAARAQAVPAAGAGGATAPAPLPTPAPPTPAQ